MILVTLSSFWKSDDVPDETIEADYVVVRPNNIQVFKGSDTYTFVPTPYYCPPEEFGRETVAWYHLEADRHYKDLCICSS
jgi:hypothetical protein